MNIVIKIIHNMYTNLALSKKSVAVKYSFPLFPFPRQAPAPSTGYFACCMFSLRVLDFLVPIISIQVLKHPQLRPIYFTSVKLCFLAYHYFS